MENTSIWTVPKICFRPGSAFGPGGPEPDQATVAGLGLKITEIEISPNFLKWIFRFLFKKKGHNLECRFL